MQPEGDKLDCTGRLVEDIQEIKEAITLLKEQGDEWYTNYYISDNEAGKWVGKKQLRIYQYEKAFFILRRKHHFSLLYYFAVSIESLYLNLERLIDSTRGIISVDVLHRNTMGLEEEVFLNHSFEKRIRLYRMRLGKRKKSKRRLPDACYANLKDAKTIEVMLHSAFDELCEQIPDLDEIEEAISCKQIMVIREDTEVVSFFWLERFGKSSIWRYWLTNPKYRDRSLAATVLYRQALALNEDATQTTLWVREDNQTVIKSYEVTGFVKDGLVDDVFCLIR